MAGHLMIDPLDFKSRPLIARLRRMRRLATLVLAAERASGSLWKSVSWTAFFCGLWMTGLPDAFGKAGTAVCFFLFWGGLAVLLRDALRRLRLPGRRDADLRLERDSGLLHRPIAALEDRLANPGRETARALWNERRKEALAALPALRPPRLRAVLAAADPAALRIGALLLLAAGFVVAGPRTPDRLRAGLFPFEAPEALSRQDDFTLWITPPAYTDLPQTVVQGRAPDDAQEPLALPEGSVVKARVRGGFFRPALVMDGRKIPLAETDGKDWAAEAPAAETASVGIRQWPFHGFSVPVRYVPDAPPVLSLKDAPRELPKGQIQIPLTARDDYGVVSISLLMTLAPATAAVPVGVPLDDTRAVLSPPGQDQDFEPVYDTAWHPWAGMPVVLLVTAEDQAGHAAALPPIHIALPEREFTHPVAKQIAALRKRLIHTPQAAAENVGYDLEAFLSTPGAYNDDTVVFLSLRSASVRLIRNPDDLKGTAAVIAQLWDTALRVEDGNLSLAARNLRDARLALEKLLADPNASQQDIAQAVDNLRQAMAEYFQETLREMQKRAGGGKPPDVPPETLGQMMDAGDLAALMEQLQDQALAGDRNTAQQLLSSLGQMMDMLDSAMNTELPEDMKFMMQGENALKSLIDRQQQLMDRTKEQTRNPEGAGDSAAGKAAQEGLRRELGQLMLDADEQLGEIPEAMQKAEQEMRGAGDSLGKGDPAAAVPRQENAVGHLQDAMDDMGQRLAQRMQQMKILSFGPRRFDPMGRPMQEDGGMSALPGSRIKIPDQAERKKVQDILKILRERSGEVQRPDYELDYYRRLLKQF